MTKQPKHGERELRTLKTTEFRIATAEDGSRTLSGPLSRTTLRPCDLGGFTELIAPSAFAGALATGMPTCLAASAITTTLILLGRTKSKTLSTAGDLRRRSSRFTVQSSEA